MSNTILDEVWSACPAMNQTQARSSAAAMLFRGEDVFKPISALSGGERARVALIKLALGENNVLLMDEPTNHLDMDSREILEEALKAFGGTIIMVSHDPVFNKQACGQHLGNGKRRIKDIPRQLRPVFKKQKAPRNRFRLSASNY